MAVMNASHLDPLSTFVPSELFLVDPGEFGNLDLLDEFHQFGSMDVPDMFPGGIDGSVDSNGLNLMDDVEASPIEQPKTSTSTDSEQSAVSSTKMRRRAQNRASQRAFRERKEKHLKSLKSTLENLGEKHQRLLDSYSQQAQIVTKLEGRIAYLHAQIAAFSTYSEQDMPPIFRVPKPPSTEFDQFDAFSLTTLPVSAGRHSVFRQSRMSDSTQLDRLPTLESIDLPEFEDLLNLP
ncbi:hypothetical protein CLAIMM_00517 isoform 1 [Cladophialophora immunda]|nr:hypothetical protein CLAIMM_00517 isoform 1 [Cladophialophora immunda]